MISKLKERYRKHEEIINYLIVGILNTIVSWTVFFICANTILDAKIVWQNVVLNTISWVVGVIFGYFANRKYVFKSTEPDMWKEFTQFSGGRIASLLLDIFVMFIMVNVLDIDKGISKLFSSALGVIVNYIVSKVFVFNTPKE